jgi:hypothetical protein
MQTPSTQPLCLRLEQLATILERLAAAQTVTDVNIAAGIALNELRGADD